MNDFSMTREQTDAQLADARERLAQAQHCIESLDATMQRVRQLALLGWFVASCDSARAQLSGVVFGIEHEIQLLEQQSVSFDKPVSECQPLERRLDSKI